MLQKNYEVVLMRLLFLILGLLMKQRWKLNQLFMSVNIITVMTWIKSLRWIYFQFIRTNFSEKIRKGEILLWMEKSYCGFYLQESNKQELTNCCMTSLLSVSHKIFAKVMFKFFIIMNSLIKSSFIPDPMTPWPWQVQEVICFFQVNLTLH